MPALLEPRPAPTMPPEEFERAQIFGVVPCPDEWCEGGVEWPGVVDWVGSQISEPELCRTCNGTGFVAGDRR